MNSDNSQPHLEVAKGLVTRTDCTQICVCLRTPSCGLKEKWGYLAASALIIYSLLYLVFLFTYLSRIYYFAPSHKPFEFLFCIAELTSKKENIFRWAICPSGWITIYITRVWLCCWNDSWWRTHLVKLILCCSNMTVDAAVYCWCSEIISRSTQSFLRAKRHSAWQSFGNDSAKALLSLSLSTVSDLVCPPAWFVVWILFCQMPC